MTTISFGARDSKPLPAIAHGDVGRPHRTRIRGPLPHGMFLRDRMPTRQAKVWAAKVRRLIAAGDQLSPDAILRGLGMEDPDHRGQVLEAYKRLLLLLLLVLSGCASLPPTNLPVCDGSFNQVCRAPVRCIVRSDGEHYTDQLGRSGYCDKTEESGRDFDWEKSHVCPAFEPVEGHPTLGSCYVYRGVQDSRQVYERVARPRP